MKLIRILMCASFYYAVGFVFRRPYSALRKHKFYGDVQILQRHFDRLWLSDNGYITDESPSTAEGGSSTETEVDDEYDGEGTSIDYSDEFGEDYIGDEEDVEEDEEREEKRIYDDASAVAQTQVTPQTNETQPISITAQEKAILEYEKRLAREVASLESKLRAERLNLSRLKDKVSESGKTGFFMVQAQVNEFKKRKSADQKARVEKNKREFVEKMLPVLDAFRAAPEQAPAETERESAMHKSFASLLDSLLVVFQKYGYTEFDAQLGSKLDARRHQIVHVEEQEEAGIILEVVRKGIVHVDGTIVRPAQVVASSKPVPPIPPTPPSPGPEYGGQSEDQKASAVADSSSNEAGDVAGRETVESNGDGQDE